MKYFLMMLVILCLGNGNESSENESKCLKSMKRVRAKRKSQSFHSSMLLLDQKSISKVYSYGIDKISEKLKDETKVDKIINFFLSVKKVKIESHEDFKENLKRLKSLRYVLKQMRFIAVMVSTENSPPKTLDSFARKLGKIEDQIKLLLKSTERNRKKAVRGLLSATQTVETLLKKKAIRKILSELKEVSLVDEEELKKKVKSEIKKISSKIKDDPSIMSAHEFHVCRIRLGKLQTIANIGSKVTSSQSEKSKLKALASYIQSLYLIMGKVHDLYVRRSLETDFSYRNGSIKMDSSIRRELAAFVNIMSGGDFEIKSTDSDKKEISFKEKKRLRIYDQDDPNTNKGVFD